VTCPHWVFRRRKTIKAGELPADLPGTALAFSVGLVRILTPADKLQRLTGRF